MILEKLKQKFDSLPFEPEVNNLTRKGFAEAIKIIKNDCNKPIVNLDLMNDCSVDDLLKMGFITCYDGEVLGDKEPESAWGIHHDKTVGNFKISIDCAFCVLMENLETDSDEIAVHIESKSDLENLINFCE